MDSSQLQSNKKHPATYFNIGKLCLLSLLSYHLLTLSLCNLFKLKRGRIKLSLNV